MMVVHAMLIAWCAYRNSFCWTETGLLPAGIIDWQYGSFDVFRVNPPLVRMWATLPVLAFQPEVPYAGVASDPRRRAEWTIARATMQEHGDEAWMWLTVARWMCLPFSLAGMWVAAVWAGRLFGTAARIGVAVLWACSPLMIGYGCLMSGDAQAACMGLITLHEFRYWLRRPDWPNTLLLGVTAGLTVLTKTSWMVLFGLLPLLWVLIRSGEFVQANLRKQWAGAAVCVRAMLAETGLAVCSLGICVMAINLAYGFDGSFRRLGEFGFISKALTADPDWRSHGFSGNRFRGTWLASVPVPLPEDLVIGMDLQKWDFDRKRSSYLRGEWRDHGWWYYYLYVLGIKVPLGFGMLAFVALIGGICHSRCREPWQEFLILAVPLAVILGAASAETGLNRHVRYVLPVVPLALVLISRVFAVLQQPDAVGPWNPMKGIVLFGATWFVMSSLWCYPHSHSHFNELIGGPLHAPRHVNASNLDWGQDRKYLRDWCQRYPETQPRWFTSYLHLMPGEGFGIPNEGHVPSTRVRSGVTGNDAPGRRFPVGWYIIDNESIVRETGDYLYLLDLKPTTYVGYGFRVYRITETISDELQARFANR